MADRPDPGTPERAVTARSGAYRQSLAHAGRSLDHGLVMGLEMVVGVLLWAGIGHLADRWLGTDPWLLGVGAMLGFAGGLYLVWLRSGREEERLRREAEATRGARREPAHG